MKPGSAAVIYLAAGIVLSACQPSSEAAKAQQTPVVKKEEQVITVSEAPKAQQAQAAQTEEPIYTVVEGNKVDAKTLEGWRTWRVMACERCHGAEQEGTTGPGLVDSLKRMTKEEFKKATLEGKPAMGMPGYNTTKLVVDNIDNLYAYLKGRSDDAIKPGRLQLITQ
ncbi:MAG: c-type cytochrome [Burkholderiales bacterium]